MTDVGHRTTLRLVTAPPDELHSIRADRVAEAVATHVTANDLYRYSIKANTELADAIANSDLNKLIAAERRLVAIGGLAQIHANHLEKGTRA